MKVAVVSPLGMSPPVVTSFVDYLGGVEDLILITTTNERVKQGYELVRVAMKLKYERTRIHRLEIPFDDVTTEDENFKFMNIAGKAIKRQKEKFGSDIVYLNVAGGRKNMCITLSILGQFLNVDGIFHVVSPNIKIVNEMLENLRPDIKRIYIAESEDEKLSIYREKEKYFNSLMFPKDYEVVRIPTIPISEDYIKRIIQALNTGDLKSLTPSERRLLERHGLLEMGKVSEFGRKLAEALIR